MKLSRTLVSILFFLCLQNSYLFSAEENDPYHVTFFNVGQGNCTILKSPENGVIVIDAGSSTLPKSVLSTIQLGNSITDYIKAYDSTYAEGEAKSLKFVISHADKDHLNLVKLIINNLCPRGSTGLGGVSSEQPYDVKVIMGGWEKNYDPGETYIPISKQFKEWIQGPGTEVDELTQKMLASKLLKDLIGKNITKNELQKISSIDQLQQDFKSASLDSLGQSGNAIYSERLMFSLINADIPYIFGSDFVRGSDQFCMPNDESFKFKMSDVEKILFFSVKNEGGDDTDNAPSVVMQANFGGKSVMLTGDKTIKETNWLINKFGNSLTLFKSDILLATHHGSSGDFSLHWLYYNKPQFLVFSACYSHGHPGYDVLSSSLLLEGTRLKELQIEEHYVSCSGDFIPFTGIEKGNNVETGKERTYYQIKTKYPIYATTESQKYIRFTWEKDSQIKRPKITNFLVTN